MQTDVRLIVKRPQIADHLEKLVCQALPGEFHFEITDKLSAELGISDVIVIDTTDLNMREIKNLPSLLKRVDPRPSILLVTAPISSELMIVIQRYADDFLVLDKITAAGFSNSVRYALHKMRLSADLVNQEQRYMSLFNNSIEASFFLNADWTVQAVNQVFNELFSTDNSQMGISGLNFGDLMAEQADFEELQKTVKLEDSFDTVLRFIKPNRGTKFSGKLSMSAIRDTVIEKGHKSVKVNGYHGTLKNVSRDQRLSEVRAKAERVQETYRLARTLAHEIRNPLTTMGLSIEQLREDLKDKQESELYFAIMERCVGRIDDLISKLLDASEIMEGVRTETDLNTLLHEIYVESTDRAHLEGITLTLAIETPTEIIKTDGLRMKLAMDNLLLNAMESIDHEEGHIVIGTYLDDNYYCIYVEDNGVGIDEDSKTTLFDPFFTTKTNGAGLGLTTVQTIIAEHQGHVAVESVKGLGSTFTLSLPLAGMEAI